MGPEIDELSQEGGPLVAIEDVRVNTPNRNKAKLIKKMSMPFMPRGLIEYWRRLTVPLYQSAATITSYGNYPS